VSYDYETLKEMAAEYGMRVNDLLALAPKNDPFYTGTPADWSRGRWFAAIYDAAGFSSSRAPHLRRIHYWTVSQSPAVAMPDGMPYENTQRCWEYLQEAAKAARYLQLVPLDGIVDNKNPQPHVNALYWDDTPGYEIQVPDLTEPAIDIQGIYTSNIQPYHVEIWCEKSTMNDVLLPLCEQYGANLVTFEGEVSITSVCVSFMDRIDEAEKPVRVFYISDFDPAGNSMPVAMARKVEYAIDQADYNYDVKIKPIALTAAQVKTYQLPRIPIKETESRAKSFEQAFGTGAVELDALEALYPGTLARIVRAELSTYYSHDAAQEAFDRASALRQAVAERVAVITSRYTAEIEALHKMQDELKAVDVDASEFYVDRFEPDVDEYDEDWLFSSDRDYLDQIAKYKAHKGYKNSDPVS